MKPVVFCLSILALSSVAIAHPHKSDEAADKLKVERIWPNFGSKSDNDSQTMDGTEFGEKLEKRFERHADEMEQKLDRAKVKNRFFKEKRDIDTLEDIRDAAVALENLISDSGVISGFADMMLDLADDFEVESNDEGMSLSFEGKRLARLKVDKDHDESFDIEGFGRNFKIDKKVIKKNGKTKTRIIIEMDGDEAFDIDLTPKP